MAFVNFADLITFTRASSGTRVNASGVIESVTTDGPRFDYDPVTLDPRGIRLEEQRTNLLTYSAQFDNAVWVKTASTVTANAAVAPDGASTADKLVEDSATFSHSVRTPYTTTTGVTYTYSVYVKAAERSFVTMYITGGGPAARFNLATGALAAGTGTIVAAGGGWYRCSITYTEDTGAAIQLYIELYNGGGTYTGDGSSGLYIWGAQLEVGAVATTYIPTTAAQVTRSADSAPITGTDFSDWWNATAGTISIVADTAGSGTRVLFQVDDGTANNRISIYTTGTTAMVDVVVGGVTQASLSLGAIAARTPFKLAFAFSASSFAGSLNGATIQTDSAGTLPTVDRCRLGADTTGNQLCGHLQAVHFYPKRMSNADVVSLAS